MRHRFVITLKKEIIMSDENVVKCEQCGGNISIGHLYSQGMDIDIARGFKEGPMEDYHQTIDVWLQCECNFGSSELRSEISPKSAEKLKQLIENQNMVIHWGYEFREQVYLAIADAVQE